MDRGEEDAAEMEKPFRLFSTKPRKPLPHPKPPNQDPLHEALADPAASESSSPTSLSSLGLADWAVSVCHELGIRQPTPVQSRCIPRILAGDDVLGIAQTGSGKTAAFALPVLHRLSEDPFGVFALVVTPTRELAVQIIEQFRALGAPLNVRCALVVGGMAMGAQAKALLQRPHVVVATPGRIKVLMEEDRDIAAVFSKTKFLVLDEADRVLDVGFEDELRVIFKCLPKSRQTLLFSATMTSDLQALLEISANKSYFYEAYEGFKTVDSLKQQYIFIPKNVKDVYLHHVLAKMEEDGIRSVIVFVSTCRVYHKNEGIRKTPIIGPPNVMASMEAPVGQLQQMNINPSQEHPSYFSQVSMNPFFSHSGSATSGYLLQAAAPNATTGTSTSSYTGHRNVEQVSKYPLASRSAQETGTCNELHSDISSYSSGNPSDDPLLDFDNIWKF